jgi:nucleotide-binding universal stress UspA family protein
MTVVVGYRAGRVGLSGLHLGLRLARSLNTSLTVATIVSDDRVRGLGSASADEAAEHLRDLARGIEVGFVDRAHRSVSGGLIEIVEDVDADVLVLGSLPSGGRGGLAIGSTADWLLHASPAPVAISPREYVLGAGALTRLTCAYSATPDTLDVVRRCMEFAERCGVPARVITFAVRGKTMFPPEVGIDAEDSILQAWAAQAQEILERLKTDGVVADEVPLEVVSGGSWAEALENADWRDGEILALGTRPRGDIRRMFLGSRSGTIIRDSPVPVLALPA